MLTESQVQDFNERAKTTNGRGQLLELREGELETRSANAASWLEDRRRKDVKAAFEENTEWVTAINVALGLSRSDFRQFNENEKWAIQYNYMEQVK